MHLARRGFTVVAVAALVGMVATTTAGPAGAAATPVSRSAGRFLSGSIAGTSLDTVAGVQGETAQNFGGTAVTRQNSLTAELLNNAIVVPLANGLQLPGLKVLTLGAVNQFARANPDGSSAAASGAVDNSGGVGVGGQNGIPQADASLDLSGLGGLGGGTLANTVGNLRARIGAVSATATQAAGQNGAQSGTYRIAGLSLDLTSPALGSLVSQLTKTGTSQLSGLLSTLTTGTTLLGGLVRIEGLDTLPSLVSTLTTLSLAGGAITVDLTSGAIHIDLAALLAAAGLDLNRLPPNTDLLPYLADALGRLPGLLGSTLTGFITRYVNALSALTITVAGIPISTAQLATLTDSVTMALSAATGPLAQAENAIAPILTTLVNQLTALLDIVVNVQETGGGVFTERAIRLDLGHTALPAAGGTVQLNLASASVGPGRLTAAPPSTAPPVTTPPGIKVSAGLGPTSTGVSPAVLGGVLLLLLGSGGVVVLRRRAGHHR